MKIKYIIIFSALLCATVSNVAFARWPWGTHNFYNGILYAYNKTSNKHFFFSVNGKKNSKKFSTDHAFQALAMDDPNSVASKTIVFYPGKNANSSQKCVVYFDNKGTAKIVQQPAGYVCSVQPTGHSIINHNDTYGYQLSLKN